MGANGRLWATLLDLDNPFAMIYEHDLVTLLCLYSIICVLLQISRFYSPCTHICHLQHCGAYIHTICQTDVLHDSLSLSMEYSMQ